MAKKDGKYGKKLGTPPKAATEAAFHEVNKDEPDIVGETRRKKGPAAAQKQKVAIALSKARRGDY